MTKRLFIFGGFDTRNYIRKTSDAPIVDPSLIVYVKTLAELGDVVVYMDNDLSQNELDKLKPYTLYAGANAHGEYDFGSYKRAYTWAKNNLNLNEYDWVYLVNDSMYAPLHPIQPMLEKLENADADASGIVYNAHKRHPHLQSWFLGASKIVFQSPAFDKLLMSVTKQCDKGAVTYLYEQGFTRMLNENSFSFAYAFRVHRHAIYNSVKKLFKRGNQFLKNTAFGRHYGALGRQLMSIMNHIVPKMREIVIHDAKRVYGDDYIDSVLTHSIIKSVWRNISYSLHKIFTTGV